MPVESASTCPACGTEIAPGLLSCPGCRRLLHADRLRLIAGDAESAEAGGDLVAALGSWRDALDLLPRGTRQRGVIEARIADLGRRVDSLPSSATRPTRARVEADDPKKRGVWGSIAGIGTLLLVMAGKVKFLLLGLTKASTFLSMFASLGVYWTVFGWRLALGLVISIYIHEMGHVAALMRYGVKASTPLFIPGLGAMIRLRQHLGDPRQDARVGLAGPLWGLGAALGSYAVHLAGGPPIWAAVARLGAWLNLFNLTPIWELDGGRAFRAFSRPQRWMAATVIALSWSFTHEGLLLLLLLVAGFRALADRPCDRPDSGSLLLYSALVAALSVMTMIPIVIGA